MAGPEGEPGTQLRQVGVPTVTARPGRPARDALFALIADVQGDDPLAPVTVAATPYAALSLRRELGRTRGLVNVRFVALARVAELLGAPGLADAGRVPLTAAHRVEAVHAALLDDPGPFAAVADHPGTDERLAATFADLRRLRPAALDTLAARNSNVAAVVRIYRRFLEITEDSYDEQDLARAAATVADAGAEPAVLRELGTVLVHLPRRLSFAEVTLLGALARRDRAAAVVATIEDEGTRGPDAPVADLLVQAPDPDDEVRAALRRLLTAADAGVPLHRMALLYPVEDPYGRLAPEVLSGADVPWNGPRPDRLADSMAGQVLGGLVELVDEDFARDSVAAWLVSGPILDGDGRRVPGARWDLVSRTAGIVVGAEQWRERLAHRRGELEAELGTERRDDEPEWRRGALDRAAADTASLDTFMVELLDRAQPPSPATWAGLSGWGRALLARYLGGEGRRADWPEHELDAARRVDGALGELASLDSLGTPVDVARFRAALDQALAAPSGHVGRFGTGIFVGPLHAAAGVDFGVVAIVGGAEGTLPPRGREDPFIPDVDRFAAGMPVIADHRTDTHHDYVTVLASADRSIVCFPRADPRAQQGRLPARWLLESASVHAQAAVTAEELRSMGPQPWLAVVASFEGGVAHDDAPCSLEERDLRSLVEWRDAGRSVREHPLATGSLRDGYELTRARSSTGFTAFDGNVGGTARGPSGAPALAATALQDWARCPFRYLLASVLRVREVARPEASDRITALDEGTLVHAILEEFVRGAPARPPGESWTASDLARMREIVARRCDDAEARGITGRPLLWRFARRRIERTAGQFLLVDTRLRRERDASPRPDGLEVPFGLDGAPEVSVVLPGARPVRFRGRIDRVDLSSDGERVVVYDYKTGRSDRYADLDDDPVLGGELLQLPVYALAALDQTGARLAEAYYWFTGPASFDAPTAGYPFGVDVRARFEEVLTLVVDGIDQGCFPAVPGEPGFDWRVQRDQFENCRYCPYDRVCPLDRGAAWTKKATDPDTAPYRALTPEPAGDVA
jgi:RecB family exonuclease